VTIDYDDYDPAADLAGDQDERDYWQEYKDDVAMGYIHPDGSQRDLDPPDPEEG
jgi:hypothetical protein